MTFIDDIAPLIVKYARQYGYKYPSAIIAQACVESAYGTSRLSAQYHNYFGLKCGTKWTGKSVNMKTKEEYQPGQLTDISANFRAYSSMDEGVRGYFDFIQLPRYYNLKFVASSSQYLEYIRADGFATSSTYADTCYAVVVEYNLLQYDMPISSERMAIAQLAKSWIGIKESDGSHRAIVDLYNSYLPHPSGYALKYTDSWCAATVSALAIRLGLTNKIPIECSCPRMLSIAKQWGIWQESDSYHPNVGDIIMYDWHDSGGGDNVGVPDHVGIVVSIHPGMESFTVVEGNKSDAVGTRDLAVNARYIRGYICPRYEEAPATPPVTGTGTPSKVAKFVGEVTASSLNVRTWAGVEYPQLKSIPTIYRGGRVYVCDTVRAKDGTDWYYILIPNGNIYGFVASSYIKKIT